MTAPSQLWDIHEQVAHKRQLLVEHLLLPGVSVWHMFGRAYTPGA